MLKLFVSILLIVVLSVCTIAAAEDLPGTIAIMPFLNETNEADIAAITRKSFYNHFSSKPYRDVELALVDEKVIHLEKSTGKNITELSPDEICSAIGCDGIVYGKVTEYTKAFAALYSQLAIETEVWMVNAKTGKEMFRFKDSVRYHGGNIPLTPLGLVMSAVSAAMNLRDVQQIRMVNELCHKLNEKIPSPGGTAIENLPSIKDVLTNVKEGPFGKGKIVKVGLEGDKGLVATFDIGNFKKGIPMREVNPGIYMGEYLVIRGDNARDMPVIASLKRPGGRENKWIGIDGFATIDTTPPPQVAGIRARGFGDRVEVSWSPLKNIPDLKGYKVLRSEQPLSGYGEFATIEFTTFEDKTTKPEITYYYRVIAFDEANNESDPQDAVKASLIAGEPVILSGELKKDTTLAGTYIVNGDLIVPRLLVLTVEAGTNIRLNETASLVVNGRFVVNGKDGIVELGPIGDKRWKGIIIEGGAITTNNMRIKNALIALNVKDSEGVIENTLITENDTGISITGIPSPVLKGSTISGNKTGVMLDRTEAKITGNSIFQNKEGIVIKTFSGEIQDNNIFNNEKNILAESPVRIGANYFGSIYFEEIRVTGASITKVYDARLPDSRIVDVVSNPYVRLNNEERQKKAKDLIGEANEYFRKRNFGKASSILEESLKVLPVSESYYYLALCYQEIKENEKAIKILNEGILQFPADPSLPKALGFIYYQSGKEAEALKAFKEVLRLSPDDTRVKFLLERMGKQ